MMNNYAPCLLCGKNNFQIKFVVNPLERQIVSCNDCGLVQVNPRDDTLQLIDFEETSSRRQKQEQAFAILEKTLGPQMRTIMEEEEQNKRLHFKIWADDLQNYCTGGRLLDMGCSRGFFLSALSPEKFQLYGVEPCPHSSEVAARLPGLKVYNCTLREAKFPADYFDAITVINTLEHIINPKETLLEIHRILKPGGILVIETPNAGHWLPLILGRRWVQYMITDHVVFFPSVILSQFLENIGYKVLQIKSACKVLSTRFLLLQFSRYNSHVGKFLVRSSEILGLANKIVRIPQWDEMRIFARKSD